MPKKKAKKRASRKRKGPSLDERVENFGEEIERLGEEIEEDFEKGEKRIRKGWHSTFGFIGPLISSIFGIVVFIILLWFLGFFAFSTGAGFLLGIRYFLATNLGVFFLLFLFFGYANYFKTLNPKAYRPVWPLVISAKIVAAIWVIASCIIVSGIGYGIGPVNNLSIFALNNLFWIFVFIAALGYLIVMLSKGSENEKEFRQGSKKMHARKRKMHKGKRLYRSGQDRILGGVCGGIGEYLKVDPVIIRLIWVVGTLILMGAGIILYIIAWIIIPRNPRDEWD